MALTMQEMKDKLIQQTKDRKRYRRAVKGLLKRGDEGLHWEYLSEYLTFKEIEVMLNEGMIERCGNSSYRLTAKARYKNA